MKALYAIAAAACLPLTAQAGPVTPREVQFVLQDYGAEIVSSKRVSETAHMINARSNGRPMFVRLDECDKFDECGIVVLFTSFQIDKPIDEETLRKTNKFNDSYPIGRAFVFPEEAGDDPASTSNLIGIDYVIDVSGESVVDGGDLQRFEKAVETYVRYWGSGS